MIEKVGIVGVGHLASYLVEGLRTADPNLEVLLSSYLSDHAERLAVDFCATALPNNQSVAEKVDLVIVSTRPGDITAACEAISFHADQLVVSTAAGVCISDLEPVVSPATPIRAMPITCAAIGLSPTLLFPDEASARTLFELLGSVHVFKNEDQFAAASVITAYYGWVYELLDVVVDWTAAAGVPPDKARALVLETTRGATEMGLNRPQESLADLLDSLATPGGITRYGLEKIRDRNGFEAWLAALDAVADKMKPVT